jgi:hypothetical protein
MQISTDNSIILDGLNTGLKVTQRQAGTVVYTPEGVANGKKYQEHKMPHNRYSTVHPSPASGVAGADDFERDIRALLDTIK